MLVSHRRMQAPLQRRRRGEWRSYIQADNGSADCIESLGRDMHRCLLVQVQVRGIDTRKDDTKPPCQPGVTPCQQQKTHVGAK
jgi:hypothetical protein